jgi:hypothetical protein
MRARPTCLAGYGKTSVSVRNDLTHESEKDRVLRITRIVFI